MIKGKFTDRAPWLGASAADLVERRARSNARPLQKRPSGRRFTRVSRASRRAARSSLFCFSRASTADGARARPASRLA